MGTRSVLGMENKPGKIYYQYMQYDGYPTGQGKDFYEAIMDSLAQGKIKYADENRPNNLFFKRVRCYLNEKQWATGHSIGAHWTINKNTWGSVDACQEWQYLFDRNGDFIFFPTRFTIDNFICTIPWEFTYLMASEWNGNGLRENKLGDFWRLCEKWGYTKKPVDLRIEYGECLAFPDQNSTMFPRGGYRVWVRLLLNGKELMKSLFYNYAFESTNKKTVKVKFESDYIKVKNTPVKDLPLLIGAIKSAGSQKLLEERMRKGK